MKQLSNTLHSNLVKLLESIPSHVNGNSVRELEFKRKAMLLKRILERCKTTIDGTRGNNEKR